MAHAPIVHGEAGGLAHVVEQHGPAQHRLRRDGGHGAGRMAPHIVEMVAVPLVKAHAGQQLRQEHAQHVGVRQQHRQHVPAAQQAVRLRQQPLCGDAAQQRGAAVQRGGGALLHGETQHRCEAQRPHDAQGVLVKAAIRLPHAAQEAAPQVLPAAMEVGEDAAAVHGHGVHRQVAAAQVLRQRVGEIHRVGAAMVGVGAIGAEGGDLYGKALLPDSDGAVLQSRGDAAAREQGGGLLRSGGGGNIPVLGHAAQQCVPHAAAHGIGREARLLQPLQNGADLRWEHMCRLPSSRSARSRQKSQLHFRGLCTIIRY